MGSAVELLNDLKRLNIRETVKDVFNDCRDGYIEKQQSQMLEGKGRDRNIGTYRNHLYSQFKNSLNPLAGLGNVDLKLTGDFFRGMTVKLQGDEIDIDSSDKKAPDLTEKYGGQIWGLNVKKQAEFNEEIFAVQLFERIEKLTGLKAV